MTGMTTRPKILIVDDSNASIRVLREIFRANHEIFIARDGADALKIVKKKELDLILLDVMMPDMDGYEVLEQLRANPETLDIPVIFITALNAGPEEIRGLDSGAVDYITKPIQPALVAARVRNQLELSQRRKMLEKLLDERERMLVELKKSRDAAEQSNQAKNAFLSTMSHEVRTPMNAIIGMTDLALKTDLNQEQRQYLEIALQSGESLLGMLNNILDFTRLEGGELELRSILFDPVEVLENACETFSVRAHYKNLELLHDVSPDIPSRLLGDPFRLRQALINLIDNGIKFTKKGTVLVRLGVDRDHPLRHPERGGSPRLMLHWRVSDTGIGIPPENREIIFERFVQGEDFRTRKYGGAGLGLATSKEIAEQLEGSLTVESPGVNQGAVFHLTLPFPVPPESAGHGYFTRSGNFSGLRILISEANQQARTIIRRTLGMCGATVVETGSHAEARDLLDAQDGKQPFHLLLLTCRRDDPEMETLAQWLTGNPRWNGKIIIMLPTGLRRYDLPGCKEITVSSGLIKPVKRFRLIHAINVVLDLDQPDEEEHTPLPEARMKPEPLLEPDETDDEELKRKRFQFMETALVPLEQLTDAMMQGKITKMLSPVRWLKYQSGEIGAKRLEFCARSFIVAINEENIADAAFQFEVLQETFRRTAEAIAHCLND